MMPGQEAHIKRMNYSMPKINVRITLGLLLISWLQLFSQNQSFIDSIERVYTRGDYTDQEQLLILKLLVTDHKDFEKVIYYTMLSNN